MLSTSQKYFIRLLNDYIHGLDSEVFENNISWDDLFSIAMSHSLEGIIYYQSSGILPEDIKRKYLKPYLAHIAYLSLRRDILQELTDRLSHKSIPIICFKGTVLSEYYPLSPLRSMGDMDIVVKVQDRETVDKILRNDMGFERFIDNHDVWTYWKGNIYIEVHTHMFYEELATQIDYQIYFDKIWDHCYLSPVFGVESDNLYIPEEEFHFLYLIAHTAKHIINNGSGFRAYLDMVLMTKSCDKMDWSQIETELSQLNLLIFAKKCMRLCERWFNVSMPIGSGKLDEEFYDTVTEKTFNDGLFGLENKVNKPANAAKELKRDQNTYYFAAIKRGLRKLFPPYEDMQLIPWYSFVDGRPWLMPVAWIYRFIYCSSHKWKHGVDLLTEPFIRKKEVNERQSYLKQWGL